MSESDKFSILIAIGIPAGAFVFLMFLAALKEISERIYDAWRRRELKKYDGKLVLKMGEDKQPKVAIVWCFCDWVQLTWNDGEKEDLSEIASLRRFDGPFSRENLPVEIMLQADTAFLERLKDV